MQYRGVIKGINFKFVCICKILVLISFFLSIVDVIRPSLLLLSLRYSFHDGGGELPWPATGTVDGLQWCSRTRGIRTESASHKSPISCTVFDSSAIMASRIPM